MNEPATTPRPNLGKRLAAYEERVFDRGAVALKRLWHRDRGLIAGLSLVAIVCFGFELFNFHLSIDEEVHAAGTIRAEEWLVQGRWGMYLLTRFMLPFPVTPVVPVAVTLASYVGSITVLLAAWGSGSTISRLLAGSMAIAFPGLAFLFTFSTMNFGIGIGFLLLSVGVLLGTRPSRMERLFGAVAFGGSIAIYQAFALAAASAICFSIVFSILDRREDDPTTASGLTVGVRGISTLILGAVVYGATQQAILSFTGRRMRYVTGYWDLDFFMRAPRTVLTRTASSLWSVYTGTSAIYVEPLALLGWLVAASVLLTLVAVVRTRVGWVWRVTMLSGLAIAIAAPFALTMANRGTMVTRSLVGVPLVLCAFVLLGCRFAPRGLRWAFAVLVAMTVLRFSVATNRLLNAGQLGLLADRALAAQLVHRIGVLRTEGGPPIKALELVGFLEWPRTPLHLKAETLGGSFFEWEQGNGYRVRPFLATMGAGVLDPPRPEQMASVVQAALRMPVWPAPGSVENVDGVAIVKLGPYSDRQRRDICSRTPVTSICP